VNEGWAAEKDRKRVASVLPFPLREPLEETLKRLEELPGRVGTAETMRLGGLPLKVLQKIDFEASSHISQCKLGRVAVTILGGQVW